MKAELKLHIVLEIPQILQIGKIFMASLGNISTALDELSTTLETELSEIAEALANTPTQAEVDAVAERVVALKDRIANIIR